MTDRVIDRLLLNCLRAYPRARRERDGEVLLSLARELSAGGSSPWGEGAGLVRGGVAERLRLRYRGVRGLFRADHRRLRALSRVFRTNPNRSGLGDAAGRGHAGLGLADAPEAPHTVRARPLAPGGRRAACGGALGARPVRRTEQRRPWGRPYRRPVRPRLLCGDQVRSASSPRSCRSATRCHRFRHRRSCRGGSPTQRPSVRGCLGGGGRRGFSSSPR